MHTINAAAAAAAASQWPTPSYSSGNIYCTFATTSLILKYCV
jgi:hypothetical protein